MDEYRGAACCDIFFFVFGVLLATQFSLRRRRIRRRQGRRYVLVSVTALTAPFICLLDFKFSRSCFNAFRRALFALSGFYAILLYFQLFRKFFRRVFRFFLFYSGAGDQRARG